MIWSVAWRNIWRSKLRSAVILCAIAIGVFAGAYIWAFYIGMVRQRIHNAIKSEASHIQIHHKKYLNDPDIKYFINNSDSILGIIAKTEGVIAETHRILMNSMVLSSHNGSGVRVIGINPDKEKLVTNLYEKVKDGHYFTGVKRNPILIGSKLAEKLKVKVRTQIILYLQQPDGEIVKGAFKIVGIYSSGNTAYDEVNLFVRDSDLINIAGILPATSHEIAILLKDDDITNTKTNELKEIFPTLDVKSWRELMPEVSLVEETMDISMMFFIGIVLLGLLFGIINTMLMAVLERIKELGMLMAVGMNKIRIFNMIMLETIFLSFTGGILGIILSYLAVMITAKTGVDLSAWSDAYARFGYESQVYPVMNLKIMINTAIMVIITGIIGALYPAYKALKLKPAEAIRTDV